MANEKNEKSEFLEEYIDIEAYAKAQKAPPKDRKYLIKIDKHFYKVEVDHMTGKQILDLAEKKPFDRFQLNERLYGGLVKKIDYNEEVYFTQPGIERFMTLPLDQTEGQN